MTCTCTIIMTQDVAADGAFDPLQDKLSVKEVGIPFGTTTTRPIGSTEPPGGIDCGRDCNELYDPGTSVTLAIGGRASPGLVFLGWDDDQPKGGMRWDRTCTVAMNSDCAISAIFEVRNRLTVTTTLLGGAASGTVTATGISCALGNGIDCSEYYSTSTMVTLTASTTQGGFDHRRGSLYRNGSTCTVSMSQARSVTAFFWGIIFEDTPTQGALDPQPSPSRRPPW